MVSRSIPHEYFVLDVADRSGPIVARLGDRTVPESVIDRRGRRYHFAGVARRDPRGRLDVTALRQGEWIVAPDLIYRRA
ncbi:hypothetical protein [Rhizobium sp. 16-449-1b]|uniref:hypothetical protein n=1 Tax=unclassified Rhizobium TaxID=2613769 RepID=UPI0009DE52B6|nr:hypothetical protein [Rhizobium sp. 16-449-1b]MBO9198330.1 hypothetical protein [Rhizobium sp. 16-449-1b]